METAHKPAESGTAAAVVESPAFDAANQDTWSADQLERWNTTGEIPVKPKTEAESAAAPASGKQTEDTEGKPKNAAESGAAPKAGDKDTKGKPTAADRIDELNGEIKSRDARLLKLEQ